MLKKILLIIVSCHLLVGCVGAFIAGAALGGVVVYEGRNIHTQKRDLKITNEANKRLGQDTAFSKRSHINLSAYDGVILLAGQTPTEELKQQAEDIVRQVPGVRRVYNEITISGPISSMVRSSDSWLTTKVKTRLLATKELDSSQIKVVTENGIVYLMGKTTPKQAKMAAEAASSITGVQKVITLFEFKQ